MLFFFRFFLETHWENCINVKQVLTEIARKKMSLLSVGDAQCREKFDSRRKKNTQILREDEALESMLH